MSDPERFTNEVDPEATWVQHELAMPLGICSMAVLQAISSEGSGHYFLERLRAGPVLFPQRLRDGRSAFFQ